MDNQLLEKTVFRKLNENDIELFISLRVAYIMETCDNVNKSDIEIIKENLNIYFRKHINKNDFLGIIGEYNGDIVSVAYLIFMDFIPNPGIKEGKTGTLFNVYTIPKYRNKGIAKN